MLQKVATISCLLAIALACLAFSAFATAADPVSGQGEVYAAPVKKIVRTSIVDAPTSGDEQSAGAADTDADAGVAGGPLEPQPFFDAGLFGRSSARISGSVTFDATGASGPVLGGSAGRKTEASRIVTGINRTLFTPLGMHQLAVGGDATSGGRAAVGETSCSESFEFGAVEIQPAAGVYWYSDRYTDYYFGLSREEAERGGLQEFETKQDISPYVGLTVDVTINDNWSAFINGEVSFPGSRLRGDSMVDSSHTQSLTTGIVYTFW